MVKQEVVVLGGHGVLEVVVVDFEEATAGEEEAVEKKYLQKI